MKAFNKTKAVDFIMAIVALAAFSSALFAIFTYGKACLNSDTALTYRFFNSMIEHHSLYPKTWNAVNGEIYTFHRLPINILMFFIIDNPVTAIVATSAVVVGLACLSLMWLSKTSFKNNSWLIAVALICVYLSSGSARENILFQSSYSFNIIAVTFMVGLFWEIVLEPKKKWLTVVYCILLFLMLAGGIRYVAEYILPLIATVFVYILFIYRRGADKRKSVIAKTIAFMALPSCAGYLFYKYLCSTHNMNFGENSNPQLILDKDEVLHCLNKIYTNCINIFGYSAENTDEINMIIMLVAFLICVFFPVLQLIKWKSMTEKELLFFIFGFMHNAEMFLTILLLGMVQERYLLSSIFVLVVVSANQIYKIISVDNKVLVSLTVVLFAVCTLYYCNSLLSVTKGWKQKFEAKTELTQRLVDKGVTKGYSAYWLGYANEVYSDGQLTFGSVSTTGLSFLKQYANVDDSAFEKKEGRSCVLFTDEAYRNLYRVFDSDRNISYRLTGRDPDDKIEMLSKHFKELYGTRKIVGFIYDDDISDVLTDGIRDGVLIPREMEFNEIGYITDEAIYMYNGGIIHGPYQLIAPGKYKVTISGALFDNCRIEVVSDNTPENITYEIISKTNDEVTVDLEVSSYVGDIQFYIYNDHDDIAEFHSIKIEKQ